MWRWCSRRWVHAVGASALLKGLWRVFSWLMCSADGVAVLTQASWEAFAPAYRRGTLRSASDVLCTRSWPSARHLHCQPGLEPFANYRVATRCSRLAPVCCTPCVQLLTTRTRVLFPLQDLAKSFAGNSTEKDKYKVFMSATEFDK